ncbi:ROK family transcriptional regulator [Shimia sp.]|uniref:ROK family transcriptional regulator n=1 Tax=Shimia sp. TaxID=1954381 RepID=UPI0032997C6D
MITQSDSIVGANAGRSRGHNRQVVLGRIQNAVKIGRAEIARASGLSTQAVSNIIADLLADGLIVEKGYRAASRGLPVAQYALNPDGGFAVGIEIRPDAISAALLNLCGEPVALKRKKMAIRNRADVARAVGDMKTAVVESAGVSESALLGVGVVMPGPFGKTGLRGGATELAIWDDTSPQSWLSDVLELPVVVENDANAAAISEKVSGVAQGLESYAYIYFGAGLGLGVVHKGRLMAGAFGNAGEIGHLRVPSDNGLVALQDAVSRLSLTRALRADGFEATSVEDLSQLFRRENPSLVSWLERAVEPLSAAVSTVECLFDPQTIILGGAMPDNILDHLVCTTPLLDSSVSNRPDRSFPRLSRGTSGRMTATLGAAALVVNQAFTPKIVQQPQEV